MADDLIFYTHPMSRGRTARWMIEEVGQPYETRLIEYVPAMKSPAYLAINPMGKVPAIKHGAVVVTETAAICAYLADAFPEAGLAPPPGDRGPYYRWLFFCAGPMEQAWTNASFKFELPEGGERRMGYGTMAQSVDALEYAVSQTDYVAGDRFSAADVFVGATLGFGMQYGMFEKRPAFEAYWARVGQRPAFLRAMGMDDALMPART